MTDMKALELVSVSSTSIETFMLRQHGTQKIITISMNKEKRTSILSQM
jgi:hypothetical protein